MHEGPNLRPENKETNEQTLVRSWKSGPVVLASGSSFKLENLKSLGMNHATGRSVPEEIEERVFEVYDGRPMHMHEMVAAIVARAKVEYVLKDGVSDDAMVCAFDTVVMKTKGFLKEKTREYLQKPETREAAAVSLAEYFESLIEGKKLRDVMTQDLPETENFEPFRSVGYPQALIHVTTGMAVRLPNAGDHVDMIPSTIRLEPKAIHALADLPDDERKEAVRDLVEEALKIMDENDRWRSVTTGLDYSDPNMKELLGLAEAKIFSDMDDSEQGILKGMPAEAFEKYLHALARESLTKD